MWGPSVVDLVLLPGVKVSTLCELKVYQMLQCKLQRTEWSLRILTVSASQITHIWNLRVHLYFQPRVCHWSIFRDEVRLHRMYGSF